MTPKKICKKQLSFSCQTREYITESQKLYKPPVLIAEGFISIVITVLQTYQDRLRKAGIQSHQA